MSVVLSMASSEGLFVALVAGALLAAHRRAWLVAGLVGAAAGLPRPTGAALALALAVAVALRLRQGAPPPERWRAVAAALLALAAVPAYLAWVGYRVGSARAWFDIQTAGWGSTFDWGVATWRYVSGALRSGDGWIQLSVAWLLIAAVVAAAVAVTQRVWPPLLVYGLVAFALVIGQGGYYHSKPRLLVPVLVVLVPLAVGLGRLRTRTAALILAGGGDGPARAGALGQRPHDSRGRRAPPPCGTPPRAGAGRLRRGARRAHDHGGAAAGQVPVAAAGRRLGGPRPPRDVWAAVAAAGGRSGRDAPASTVQLQRRRAAAALRRPAYVRRPVGLARRRGAARRDRAHRARPARSVLCGRGVRRGAPAPAHGGEAGPARPDPDLRGGQHLRRRGAVAGAAVRRPADRGGDPAAGPRAARAGTRGADRGDRSRGHQLRRALRQRQRRKRVLRPQPRRLRARWRAVPQMRYADPPRGVHEPVVVLVPALPTAPAAPASRLALPAATGRRPAALSGRSPGSSTACRPARMPAPRRWPWRRS